MQSKKKNIVLIPGLLNTEKLFEHFIKNNQNNYNIITVIVKKSQNIQDAAIEVLSESPSSFILCGISMGGYIAMEIMRQQPKRVEKLILMDTTPLADSETKIKQRTLAIEQAKNTEENFVGVTNTLLKTLVVEPTTEILEELQKMAKEIGVEGFINQQKTIMSRPNSIEDLKNYQLPTLIINGELDQLTPIEDHEILKNNIKNSKHMMIKNCGHLPPIEKPEILNKIINDFINENI